MTFVGVAAGAGLPLLGIGTHWLLLRYVPTPQVMLSGAEALLAFVLDPPQLELLPPQANVPANPAANAMVDARKIQFFIFSPIGC